MATIDRRGVSVDATDTPIAGDPNPGLAIKAPALVATTGNITLSGVQPIDGVTVGNNNERVLVWQQADQTTNGLYNASSGPWTRTVDLQSNDQLADGMLVMVAQGSTFENSQFQLTTADPINIGSSAIVFQGAAVISSRNVNTTAPLAGGGNLSVDRTLSLVINGSLQVTGGALAVASSAGVTHQWVSSFSAAGVPQYSRPAAVDIASGAALTGANDTNVTVTISAGGAAALLAATSVTLGWTGTLAVARGGTGAGAASGTALDNITGFASTGFLTRTGSGTYAFQSATNGITNGNLAQAAAWTLKGNPTAALANVQDFTIDSLTLKASPASSDEIPIWDAAGATMKKATVASVAVAGSVASIGGQTGVITLAGGALAGTVLTTIRYDLAQSLTATQQLQGRNNIGGCVGIPDVIVEEQQSSGTSAGTFTSGSFVTRSLNIILAGGSIASISGGQVTLPAGTYFAKWSAPAVSTDQHATRLQNITAATTIAPGSSELSTSTNGVSSRSEGSAEFTLSGSSAIAVQHRCVTTSASTGLGRACSFGQNEVYSRLEIWKLS